MKALRRLRAWFDGDAYSGNTDETTYTTTKGSESSDSTDEDEVPFRKKSGGSYLGDYRMISKLGHGRFSTVYLTKNVETDLIYALKVVKQKGSREELLRNELRIMEHLRKNRHKMIVKFYEVIEPKDFVCFVLEYLGGGTLYRHVKGGPLNEQRSRFYSACMLCALDHLHRLNIAHKDIKAQNVVLNRYGYAVLVDFGHSQMNIFSRTPLRNKLGTERYKAPEFFDSGPVYREVDFWALCVTLHLMLTGKYIRINPRIEYETRNISTSAADLMSRVFRRVPAKRLGSGSRGAKELMDHEFFEVVSAKHESTDRVYAIKIVLKSQGRMPRLKMEMEILEMLTIHKHPSIVEYYGAFQTNGHMCFVLEYLECGTILQQVRYGPLSEEVACFYAACMLSALDHLHSLNIAHKDIKPQNVVVNSEGYAKLVDFGHSQMGITYTTPLRNKLGTRRYKAPEYFLPGPIYRFVDYWALCVTLHFMLTGKHQESYVEEKIKKKHLSDSAYDLLSKVFVDEPFDRLGSSERGAREIMEHEFFENIDWEGLRQGRVPAPKVKQGSMPITSPNLIYKEVTSIESFVELEA